MKGLRGLIGYCSTVLLDYYETKMKETFDEMSFTDRIKINHALMKIIEHSNKVTMDEIATLNDEEEIKKKKRRKLIKLHSLLPLSNTSLHFIEVDKQYFKKELEELSKDNLKGLLNLKGISKKLQKYDVLTVELDGYSCVIKFQRQVPIKKKSISFTSTSGTSSTSETINSTQTFTKVEFDNMVGIDEGKVNLFAASNNIILR